MEELTFRMRVTFRKVTLRRREICRRSVKFWKLIFDWLLFSYRPLECRLVRKKREKKETEERHFSRSCLPFGTIRSVKF